MSCILKYFSFLCQLKGHKARNKLETKDFDLKFEHKTDSWQIQKPCVCVHVCFIFFVNSKLSSEKIKELFINFHTFDFRPRYLPKYIGMGDFPPNNFFLECVEALHQISASQVECKWKKGGIFEGQSFHILSKSVQVLNQNPLSPIYFLLYDPFIDTKN